MANNQWTTEDGAKEKDTRTYISIRGDGNACAFRFPSDESDSEAKKEVIKKKDGSEKTVYERHFTELKDVTIESISFHTHEFDGRKFTNLNVGFVSKTGKTAVLSLAVTSSYADDLMKKIPAIDLTKPVYLAPFNFLNDNGKTVAGITVKQNDEKVVSFFNVYDKDGKRTNEVKHGFPLPAKTNDEVKEYSEERRKLFWQNYFGEVRIFLQEYTETNIIPKLPKANGYKPADKIEYPEEEFDPSKIPF